MQVRSSGAFTPEDLDFMKNGGLFEKKEEITRRIQELFKQLEESLKAQLKPEDFLAPEGTDFLGGQLVRGERFHHRPYVYLDFPKYFSRSAMFTYRSFFWWGWDFVFAWILSGPFLERYKANLIASADRIAGQGFYLSLAPDPWEWRKSSPFTSELLDPSPPQMESLLSGRSFLKIQYFIGLDDPIWQRGEVAKEGVRVFEQLKFIVLKPQN